MQTTLPKDLLWGVWHLCERRTIKFEMRCEDFSAMAYTSRTCTPPAGFGGLCKFLRSTKIAIYMPACAENMFFIFSMNSIDAHIGSLQSENVLAHLQGYMTQHLAHVSDTPKKIIRCDDKWKEKLASPRALWGFDLLHVCHNEVINHAGPTSDASIRE